MSLFSKISKRLILYKNSHQNKSTKKNKLSLCTSLIAILDINDSCYKAYESMLSTYAGKHGLNLNFLYLDLAKHDKGYCCPVRPEICISRTDLNLFKYIKKESIDKLKEINSDILINLCSYTNALLFYIMEKSNASYKIGIKTDLEGSIDDFAINYDIQMIRQTDNKAGLDSLSSLLSLLDKIK